MQKFNSRGARRIISNLTAFHLAFQIRKFLNIFCDYNVQSNVVKRSYILIDDCWTKLRTILKIIHRLDML